MTDSPKPRIRLTLLPGPPPPLSRDRDRAELLTTYDGLDVEGRRMLLAQARAVAEVTGRVPRAPGAPEGA